MRSIAPVTWYGGKGLMLGILRRRIRPRDVRRSHAAALTALGNAVVPQCAALFLRAMRTADTWPMECARDE